MLTLYENLGKLKKPMEDISFDIGKKIKDLRLKAGLTLKQVAKETGFSPALISQIENNNISPPIATLAKLASYFNVKIGYFFEDDKTPVRYTVCRKEQGRRIDRVISKSGKRHGYIYQALAFDFPNKSMEPFLITLDTGVDDSENMYSHNGEEFIMVTEGEILVLIEGEKIYLKEGDSIYFDSSAKHRVLNPSDREARILAVIMEK